MTLLQYNNHHVTAIKYLEYSEAVKDRLCFFGLLELFNVFFFVCLFVCLLAFL